MYGIIYLCLDVFPIWQSVRSLGGGTTLYRRFLFTYLLMIESNHSIHLYKILEITFQTPTTIGLVYKKRKKNLLVYALHSLTKHITLGVWCWSAFCLVFINGRPSSYWWMCNACVGTLTFLLHRISNQTSSFILLITLKLDCMDK